MIALTVRLCPTGPLIPDLGVTYVTAATPGSREHRDAGRVSGLNRALFRKLAACDWIAERPNLPLAGASGLGKSWLACALGHKACRENFSVLYIRMPRLLADLAIAHGDARCARLLRSL